MKKEIKLIILIIVAGCASLFAGENPVKPVRLNVNAGVIAPILTATCTPPYPMYNTDLNMIWSAIMSKSATCYTSCPTPPYPFQNSDNAQIWCAIMNLSTGGSDTGAWALGGNTVTFARKFGTKNGYGIPFITNNTTRMTILSNGHFDFVSNLYDSGDNLSHDLNNRQLSNLAGVTIDYDLTQLQVAGVKTLDWGNQIAYDAGGSITSLDWANRLMRDAINGKSVDYNNRYLYDASEVKKLDYNARYIYDKWTADSNMTVNGFMLGRGKKNLSANTGFGYNVFNAITSGNYNTSIGYQSGQAITSGTYNNGFGWNALQNLTTGSYNVAIGYAGASLTTSNQNTAVGYAALLSESTGSNNTAFGSGALQGLNGGKTDNAAFGLNALSSASVGYSNAAFGRSAGQASTGNYNVFLGNYAGYYETGDNKLYIDNAQRSSESDARQKALLYGVFAGSVVNQSLRVNSNLILTYSGQGTLVNGIDTIFTSNITSNSLIFITTDGLNGSTARGVLHVKAKSNGNYFVVESTKSNTNTETGDQSIFDWFVIEKP